MTLDAIMSMLPGLWLATGILCFIGLVVVTYHPRLAKDHECHGALPFVVEDRIDG